MIDITTKKKIKQRKLSTRIGRGFAYNPLKDIIYINKRFQYTLLKYDKFAERILDTTTIEPGDSWNINTGDMFFGEAIAINPVTNKIYVSNSGKHILYEIDG